MSYLRGLYLDSFQTTKRHSYDGYSIYIAIFNSFYKAVYPVGVTTNRSCFTRITGHNSCTIHQSCTKFDTRICLWAPFLYATFQGDRSTRLRNQEKNRSFGSWYLENGWSDFHQIWNVDSLAGGQLCSKFGSNRIRDHRDTKV